MNQQIDSVDEAANAEGLFTKEQYAYVDSIAESHLRYHLLHQVRLRDNMEADRNAFEKMYNELCVKYNELKQAQQPSISVKDDDVDALIDKFMIERGTHPSSVRDILYSEERELAKNVAKATPQQSISVKGLDEDELIAWVDKLKPDYDNAQSYQHGFFDAMEVVKDKLEKIKLTYKAAIKGSYSLQDGWIDVNDRLPDESKFGMSEDVLTIAGSKMAVKSYDYQLNRWNGSPHITITHWQPLPQPPNTSSINKVKQ